MRSSRPGTRATRFDNLNTKLELVEKIYNRVRENLNHLQSKRLGLFMLAFTLISTLSVIVDTVDFTQGKGAGSAVSFTPRRARGHAAGRRRLRGTAAEVGKAPREVPSPALAGERAERINVMKTPESIDPPARL